MATYRVYKETALPGTLQPHSVYFVAPAGNPALVEIYVTNADASAHRRVLTEADVSSMISSAISASQGLVIVDDIAERNALTPSGAMYAYVVDASDDPTVAAGGATYLYNPATTSWIKTSEAESLDISLTWAAISGGPTSTPAQIDSAVANSHTHANLTQLNLIGQNGAGELTYNGSQVKTIWSTTAW